jgi:hypothetical protein
VLAEKALGLLAIQAIQDLGKVRDGESASGHVAAPLASLSVTSDNGY